MLIYSVSIVFISWPQGGLYHENCPLVNKNRCDVSLAVQCIIRYSVNLTNRALLCNYVSQGYLNSWHWFHKHNALSILVCGSIQQQNLQKKVFNEYWWNYSYQQCVKLGSSLDITAGNFHRVSWDVTCVGNKVIYFIGSAPTKNIFFLMQ